MKYLGIYIDAHLNWSSHVDALSTKLNRGIGMLAKIRHYVPKNTLRSIYYGIFSSLLTYASQVWGQFRNNHVRRIESLQNKAIRIINFAPFNSECTKLYKDSKILKLMDHVKLQNFIFTSDSINKRLPSILNNKFQYISNLHTLNTRVAENYIFKIPRTRTYVYGTYSITIQCGHFWNEMISKFPEEQLYLQNNKKCKKFLMKTFFNSYV